MTLDEYLTATNQTALAFAEAHGFSNSAISRLRNGQSWPEPDLIARLIEATDQKVTLDGLYRAWHAARSGVGLNQAEVAARL